MQRFIAFLLIVIFLPIFVFLGFLNLVYFGIPVIFTQRRAGKDSKIFTIYKYRTMLNSKDSNKSYLPDSQRITRYGNFLRLSSLDELPELFNVLKGDMAFVGSRPLLEEYLPLYSSDQAKRHNVLPGITGFAQINGRNMLSWEERFKLDVWYVENKSLWLDLKILFITFFKVFKREGIYNKSSETMPVLQGKKK